MVLHFFVKKKDNGIAIYFLIQIQRVKNRLTRGASISADVDIFQRQQEKTG